MQRDILRWTFIPVAYIVVILGTTELLARFLFDFVPFPPLEIRDTKIVPAGPIFEPDPVLGFALKPGCFTITLDGKLRFEAIHNQQRLRDQPVKSPGLPEIWIFGCSFTYGWGTDAEYAYPNILDSRISDVKVVNFGVPAYGTTQSLLQFREALKTRKPPALVVLGYASFHDQRNTGERAWLRALCSHTMMLGYSLPVARISEEEGLIYEYEQIEYKPTPGAAVSSFCGGIEMMRIYYDIKSLESQRVTGMLLNEFAGEAKTAGAKFLVAGVDDSENTRWALKEIAKSGMEVADISEGMLQETGALLLDGKHPSGIGHRFLADKIEAILTGYGIH